MICFFICLAAVSVFGDFGEGMTFQSLTPDLFNENVVPTASLCNIETQNGCVYVNNDYRETVSFDVAGIILGAEFKKGDKLVKITRKLDLSYHVVTELLSDALNREEKDIMERTEDAEVEETIELHLEENDSNGRRNLANNRYGWYSINMYFTKNLAALAKEKNMDLHAWALQEINIINAGYVNSNVGIEARLAQITILKDDLDKSAHDCFAAWQDQAEQYAMTHQFDDCCGGYPGVRTMSKSNGSKRVSLQECKDWCAKEWCQAMDYNSDTRECRSWVDLDGSKTVVKPDNCAAKDSTKCYLKEDVWRKGDINVLVVSRSKDTQCRPGRESGQWVMIRAYATDAGYTLAHEVGHSLGIQHNWGAQGSKCGSLGYACGYIPVCGYSGVRTVMAYDSITTNSWLKSKGHTQHRCYQENNKGGEAAINFYSDPNRNYKHTDGKTYKLGHSKANNVKALRNLIESAANRYKGDACASNPCPNGVACHAKDNHKYTCGGVGPVVDPTDSPTDPVDPNAGSWVKLFSAAANSKSCANYWLGWFRKGEDNADLKTADFDTLAVDSLKFVYDGDEGIVNLPNRQTILELISGCGIDSSSRNTNTDDWQNGHCKLDWVKKTGAFTGDQLRIGVGDKQKDSRDWALFMFVNGNGDLNYKKNQISKTFNLGGEDFCSNTGSSKKIEIFGRTTTPKAVNGGWGNYGSWSKCTKTCGGGKKSRTRKCDNPKPANGGSQCSGSDTQTVSCSTNTCPVNGGWGNYGSWSGCSKTCGGGEKTRTRKCDNPEPAHGGSQCEGSDTQKTSCNTHQCSPNPVNGAWGSWSSYGKCSKQCGGGTKTRTRKCNNPSPQNNGKICSGHDKWTTSCNVQTCTSACPTNSEGTYPNCYCIVEEKEIHGFYLFRRLANQDGSNCLTAAERRRLRASTSYTLFVVLLFSFGALPLFIGVFSYSYKSWNKKQIEKVTLNESETQKRSIKV